MDQNKQESRHKVTERHTIWRGLEIHKVRASPYWQVRLYDRTAKRYVTRSTKEKLKRNAIEAAETMARTGILKAPVIEVINTIPFEKTFEYFAGKALGLAKIKGKKYAARDDERILYRRDDGLIAYFGTREIEGITSAEITEYFAMMDETRDEPLSASTKNKHRFVLNRVFNAAVEERALTRLPAIQTFSTDDTPRPAFSDQEYDELLNMTKSCIKRGDTVFGNRVTDEILHLIRFMVSSFVRPLTTELMAIKLGDLTPRSDRKSLEVKINGKTGKRVTVTMPDGAKIVAAQSSETGRSDSSAFLFFPDVADRAKALTIARQQFNHILAAAHLKQDYEGNARTLYSLRHFAIQKRLRDSGGKTNIYTLAANAGTSVEMLQRFYLAKMALSDDMVKNLHHDEKEEEARRAAEAQRGDKITFTTPGPYTPMKVAINPERSGSSFVAKTQQYQTERKTTAADDAGS
ncbi:hypothetical protein [Gemmobacter serpentinus]|uniref:hypothetical protein n=1 Tax=Gemmobacter serpentinus TaxID=2652247 RepID=UPI00124EA17A|nr:hypothetical protein [Gemmobacter serpentinus]